jgi:hypothetical protein
MAWSSINEDAEERWADALHTLSDDPVQARRQLTRLWHEARDLEAEHRRYLERARSRHEEELAQMRQAHAAKIRELEHRFAAGRKAFFRGAARAMDRERASIVEAIDQAVPQIEAARPSKGFLGVQIGETGTAVKIDDAVASLREAINAAPTQTETWLSDQEMRASAPLNSDG